MSDKFAVRLRAGIDPARRAEMAARAAPRFGIEPDKIERLLARGPGVVTRATSEAEAERVADIFNSVGAQAEVVAVGREAERPPGPPPAPGAHADDAAVSDAVLWSPGDPAPRARGGRSSLRWKVLLAVLAPALLLAAATTSLAYLSVADSSLRLHSEVGDNIAQTLAADLSAFLTENGLQISDPAGRQQIASHFAEGLARIAPSLHETAGVHLTDDAGRRIAGFWDAEVQRRPDFAAFAERFDAAARATLANADFGDPGEALAASLGERSVRLGDFYAIGAPLINDVGTVQVVISAGEVARTTLEVIRPVLAAALLGLLLATLAAVWLVGALARGGRQPGPDTGPETGPG